MIWSLSILFLPARCLRADLPTDLFCPRRFNHKKSVDKRSVMPPPAGPETVLLSRSRAPSDYSAGAASAAGSAGASAGWNPLANLIDDKYLSASDNLSGRTFVEFGGLKDGVLSGLKLAVNFGFDLVSSKAKTYYNPYCGNAVSKNGLAEIEDGRTFSYTFNQLLTWDRKFGDFHIDLLAGHEAYAYDYQYLMGYKSGYPFGNMYELAPATTLEDTNSYTNTTYYCTNNTNRNNPRFIIIILFLCFAIC